MTVLTRRVEDELGQYRLVFYVRGTDNKDEWIDVPEEFAVIPERMV